MKQTGEGKEKHETRAGKNQNAGNDKTPRYLLLDEPTANLDPAHQHALLETARRARREGIGVMAILHDLNLASMYADRIVILQRGRVMAEGRPATVLTEETIYDIFGLAVRVSPHPIRTCPHIVAL